MAAVDSNDDDLFEFDEFAEDTSAPEAAPVESRSPVERPERQPAPAPLGGSRSMSTIDDYDDYGDEDQDADPADFPEAPVRAGMPPIVVPLLLVMAFANLALVGLTWKSMNRERAIPVLESAGPGQAARVEGERGAAPALGFGAPETDRGGAATSTGRAGRSLRSQLPELTSSRDDAWAILEEAGRAMDAGEFAPARRRLYGMLTVLDRFEQADRPDLESRAGYLIAESYRRQAQALGRASEQAAEASASSSSTEEHR